MARQLPSSPALTSAIYLEPCPDSAPGTNLYYIIKTKRIVVSRSGIVDEAGHYVLFHRDSGDSMLRFSYTAMR